MQEKTADIEEPGFDVGPPLPGISFWQEAGSAGNRSPHPASTTWPVLLTAPWLNSHADPDGVNEPVTL
ncbi:MAG TPA: hypothetical protein VGH53_09790 [Streptosporangiaceae bacterium]